VCAPRVQGYRCLVPDLYKGALGVSVEEAHHLMTSLDWPGARGEGGAYQHASLGFDFFAKVCFLSPLSLVFSFW
jgi:hypothetical protein